MKSETQQKILVWFILGNVIISLIAPFTSIWFAIVPLSVVCIVGAIIERVCIFWGFDWIKEDYYNKFLKMKIIRIKPWLTRLLLISIMVCLFSFIISAVLL